MFILIKWLRDSMSSKTFGYNLSFFSQLKFLQKSLQSMRTIPLMWIVQRSIPLSQSCYWKTNNRQIHNKSCSMMKREINLISWNFIGSCYFSTISAAVKLSSIMLCAQLHTMAWPLLSVHSCGYNKVQALSASVRPLKGEIENLRNNFGYKLNHEKGL